MKTGFYAQRAPLFQRQLECQPTAKVWAALYGRPGAPKRLRRDTVITHGARAHLISSKSILWPPMGEIQSLGGLTRSHLNQRRDEHSSAAHNYFQAAWISDLVLGEGFFFF